MKFFQKRGVAIVVLILAIVASSAWGLHKTPAVSTPEGGEKLDPSLSTAAFEQYVRDEANVLSDKAEKAVSLYNANWDKMFGSIMAVVTVQSSDNLENTAYDYADTMQLGSNDAILVIAKQQQDYYLVASGDFYDLLSGLSQSFVASCMADNVQKGDYDAAVRSLCAALHVELSQQYQQSEAALDEANVANFADYLKQYSHDTQFIVVTHRKGTMERCDSLYGVAMEEKGVSSMVSVNLENYH